MSFTFFLRYYVLKNPAICTIARNSTTRILASMGLVVSTNNNISFHFRILPRKTNAKILQKIAKPYFRTIVGPFSPNLGKNKYSWKKGICQFFTIPVIYHCAKNQKKLMTHSWEKCQTDVDRQTDRKQWFYRTPRWTRVQKER